jgi:hypothetical protein
MSDRDYSEIEKKIISFAIQRKEVLGISKGYDPEGRNRIYWLLTGNMPYSREFEDNISLLNLDYLIVLK